MTAHLTSDAELVQATLKDLEAFSEIMARYETKLIRYIKRFTGLDTAQCEDIVQETFLKTYRNLNDFDQSLKFSSWIYRIAHNEAVNFIKKHHKQITVSLQSNDDTLNLIEKLASDINIIKDVKDRELSLKVKEILQNLKPEFQEVLILKFLEDKNYQEISDILKKPMGTVATLINRAKSQFKMLATKNSLIS